MHAFLSSLLGKRFWLSAWLAIAAGFLLPGNWLWVMPSMPWLLAGILFFSSLRLGWTDLAQGFSTPGFAGRVAVMSLVKLVLLPVLVWMVVVLCSSDWSLGVLLTWLMPASMSTIALADLLGGNRVLALAYVASTNILAPLSIPILLTLGGGHVDAGMLVSRAVFILALLALPFVAAQIVRYRAPGFVARGHAWWSRLSLLSMILLCFAGTAGGRQAWAGWSIPALGFPLLLVCLGTTVSFVVGMAFRRCWPYPDAITFAIGAVFMNGGLAMACSNRFFPGDPYVILPAVLAMIPAMGMTALAGLLRPPAVPNMDPAGKDMAVGIASPSSPP
jgi:predicted Na+-dependent transporter